MAKAKKKAKKKQRVVVTVDGGLVRLVAADSRDIEVYVFDYDDIHESFGALDLSNDPKDRIWLGMQYGTKAVDQELENWATEVGEEQEARKR